MYASQRTLGSRPNINGNNHNSRRPPLSLPPNQDELFSIEVAPQPHPMMASTCLRDRGQPQHSTFRQQPPKSKPNSLPVLNCLFAALGKKISNDLVEDDTTCNNVPDIYHKMNNNIVSANT